MAAEVPDGAVLIARAIFNSSLWTMRDSDRILAITLIGLANWKDRKWFDGKEEILIRRGELVRSIEDLSESARLSVKKVRTSLKHLEKTGFLARKPTRRYTHITLCKYDIYQNLDNYSDKVSGEARARLGQPPGTHPARPGHAMGNKQEGYIGEQWEEREQQTGAEAPMPLESSPAGLLAKAYRGVNPGALSYKLTAEKCQHYLDGGGDFQEAEQLFMSPAARGKRLYDLLNQLDQSRKDREFRERRDRSGPPKV
jgi:hypothetical protein